MSLNKIKTFLEEEAERTTDCGNDDGWKGCLLFSLMIIILASLAMWVLD